MRNILLVFLLSWVISDTFGQVQFLGSPTTTVRNRGNFVSDSLFYLPKRTKAPSDSGALRYQISDSALYVWTGSQWIKAGGGAGSMTGTLTTNYIPKATGSTTLGNSVMYDSSSHVRVYGNWIGSGNSNRYLFQTEVDGQNGYGLKVQQNDSNDNNLQWVMSMRHGLLTTAKPRPEFGVGHDMQLPDDAGTFRRVGSILTRLTDTTAAGISAKMQFGVAKSGSLVTPLQIYSDSSIRMAKLAGSGTRYVVADANGDLTASASLASVDTFSISTRAWRQKGDDSLASLISERVRISDTASMLNPYVRGSGTSDRIPKWSANTRTLIDGGIVDLSTTERMRITAAGDVGIGTTDPTNYSNSALSVYRGSGNSLISTISADATAGSGIYILGSNLGNNWFQIRQYSASAAGTALGINNAGSLQMFTSSTSTAPFIISQQAAQPIVFGTNLAERMRITSDGELLIGTTTDAGAYALQVAGAIYNTTTITTGAPTSGSAKPWRLGEAATVSPTSPNRTIRVEIDGTVYYLHAKTTND